MRQINITSRATFTLVVAIIILAILLHSGLSNSIHSYLRVVSNPVVSGVSFLSKKIAKNIYIYIDAKRYYQRNLELNQKIVNFYKQNLQLSALKKENQWLKKEIQFLEDVNYNYQIARVLATNYGSASGELIINKGTLHGLRDGLAVTTDQGVMIGKINQAQQDISYIELLVSSQAELSVMVKASQVIYGICQGEHNLSLNITMLPKGVAIEEGDIVATSGFEKDIPSGLIIGEITKVENQQEELWQKALAEPLIDARYLSLVTVIIPQ